MSTCTQRRKAAWPKQWSQAFDGWIELPGWRSQTRRRSKHALKSGWWVVCAVTRSRFHRSVRLARTYCFRLCGKDHPNLVCFSGWDSVCSVIWLQGLISGLCLVLGHKMRMTTRSPARACCRLPPVAAASSTSVQARLRWSYVWGPLVPSTLGFFRGISLPPLTLNETALILGTISSYPKSSSQPNT